MEHRRMFWLLLLVVFQPAITRADCSFISHYITCVLTSLHTGVPLTTYISNYASRATKAVSIEFRSSTINTVPVGVFHALSTVEILYMNNASINSISPGAFSGMTQLQELYLNINNISELQAGTFDGLVQLKRVQMSGNKLTKLIALNGLTKLEWLILNSNNIETIDDDAFKDTDKLEYLDMRNNMIRSVPCNELMGSVDVQFNRITSLVNCSKNILHLDVSYNHLTELPAMFFNEAASLVTLGVNHNYISSIHGDAFVELRHLTKLTMNNNSIITIPIGAFRNLAKLTTLDLANNNLMDLKFGVFTGLTSLKKLDVSNNKIARLESKVLYPLKSLTELKLDGNLLRNFDADTIVSHLTTLKFISLDRNQMQCDWLTNCIYVFTLHNITVLSGDSFNTSNIHGIYCIGEHEHGNSALPTAAVVPNTTVAPVWSVSNVEHASTTPNLSAGDKIPKALLAKHEKTNDLLVELLKANSTTPFLLIFLTVAVVILIIIILTISLFNMYSIRRINMKEKKRRTPSSCGVELLHITD